MEKFLFESIDWLYAHFLNHYKGVFTATNIVPV